MKDGPTISLNTRNLAFAKFLNLVPGDHDRQGLTWRGSMTHKLDFTGLARRRTEESIAVKQALLADNRLLRVLEKVAQETSRALASGRKVLLFGNGGSAADAQHIAAEWVGRYRRDRRALPAIALTVNASSLTAIANDFNFEQVFARQVEALGAPGDIAIGISTSGDSPNVLRGVEAAKVTSMITVGLTGRTGGSLKTLVDYCLRVPSDDTPRIQEAHILLGHILCEYVEEALFGGQAGKREVSR
jgi:D-sedoheptulose 7-phosphate isomerase